MSNYPMVAYHFSVDWGGGRIGFESVTGLDINLSVVEYREGNSPEFHMTKMPGSVTYSNLVLKRGLRKGDNNFYEWFNTVRLNTIERRDLTISLLNDEHEPVVVWRIKQAFPVRYSGPELNARECRIAYEELEITHEGMTVSNN